MLTREKCEELKAAGYEQTIRCGDWYYRKREQPDMGKGEVWSLELWCGDDWVTKRTDILKCPSTGELISAVMPSDQHQIVLDRAFDAWSVTLTKWDGYAYQEVEDTDFAPNLDTALAELWLKLKEAK